jgi:predicted RNA binding protein YcfA (HicA-like mRNA interferase family)
MKYSEIKKLLRKNGCYFLRDGGKHEIWYSPITGNKFQVGRHNTQDCKKGTLNAILSEAGLK